MMDSQLYDSLSEKYASYTDGQIVEILKKHKFYQPEAAKLAVEEAIRRGVIHNEDDLLAPEFRQMPRRFSLFPAIENQETKRRFQRSMSRIILFIGFLPIIYGILKIADKKTVEAAVFIGFGVVWSIISIFLLKNPRASLVYPLLVLAAISVIFATKLLLELPALKFTDVFVFLVVSCLTFYILIYQITLSRRQ
jgi:hypothetical protein